MRQDLSARITTAILDLTPQAVSGNLPLRSNVISRRSPIPALLLSLIWLGCRSLASAAPTACADIPHADHPKATLRQGQTTAVVFLPNSQTGYYRASRFDWAGVVPCLNYRGHTFFGEWFPTYDPLLNDAITGPVEEFRSEDGALGYGEAKPGQPFVKIGVGVLRRLDDTPYKFGITYPLLDAGKRATVLGKDRVTFTQELHAPTGVSYRYQKVLRLEDDGKSLVLEHSLTNLGARPIVTDVYDHDFYMLDGKSTGPGMRVHVAFPLKAIPPPTGKADGTLEPAATIEESGLVYKQLLAPHQTVASYLGGYGATAKDYDITFSDTNSGLSVRQTADHPISRFYLWSIPTTVAPEAYIHLDIAPGATERWTIRYTFQAP